jgi:hypothetical protein
MWAWELTENKHSDADSGHHAFDCAVSVSIRNSAVFFGRKPDARQKTPNSHPKNVAEREKIRQ